MLSPGKLGLVCGEDQSVGLGQLPELGALMLKEYITILKKRSIIDFYLGNYVLKVGAFPKSTLVRFDTLILK